MLGKYALSCIFIRWIGTLNAYHYYYTLKYELSHKTVLSDDN